jgi:hypothetical protein
MTYSYMYTTKNSRIPSYISHMTLRSFLLNLNTLEIELNVSLFTDDGMTIEEGRAASKSPH